MAFATRKKAHVAAWGSRRCPRLVAPICVSVAAVYHNVVPATLPGPIPHPWPHACTSLSFCTHRKHSTLLLPRNREGLLVSTLHTTAQTLSTQQKQPVPRLYAPSLAAFSPSGLALYPTRCFPPGRTVCAHFVCVVVLVPVSPPSAPQNRPSAVSPGPPHTAKKTSLVPPRPCGVAPLWVVGSCLAAAASLL